MEIPDLSIPLTDVLNIYDKESYLKGNPVLIGTYETNERGERVFKQVV